MKNVPTLSLSLTLENIDTSWIYKKCVIDPVPDRGLEKISGSPEGHLKQNFEISPLGHLLEPKTGLNNQNNL